MADLVDQAELAALKEMLKHLAQCTFLPGYWDKRFVRNMHQSDPAKLTENQRNQVRRLAYKYRRQMPAAVVPARVKLPKEVMQ